MKVGLSTWSLLSLDVVSAIRAIGDRGFEYIELWGEAPHAHPGWVDRNGLKDALSTYDMTLTMHAPFTDLNPANPFEPVRGATEKALEDFVGFSDSLGAEVITVHPGSVHNAAMVPDSSETSISALRRMARAADERLAISVENQTRSGSKYHYPLGSTPDSIQYFLTKVDDLRFTLDPGHAHAGSQDPSDFTRVAGPKLVEVHLSDNAGTADDHLVPGEGTADLKKLTDGLSGTDVLICLEINPHRYTPEQVLRASALFKTGV